MTLMCGLEINVISRVDVHLRDIVGRLFLKKKLFFAIPRLTPKKKDELREAGIFRIEELPADYSLTDNQQTYVDSVLDEEPTIDWEAIRVRLSDLEYPMHFFDFETDNPPIPKFQGLRPFQPFPFQYSCHKWHSDGR